MIVVPTTDKEGEGGADFFFLYQQFITRGAMAGRGNYLVATIH